MHIRVGALVGWAIVIYAVMYLVADALALYGLAGSAAGWFLSLVTLVLTTTIATHHLHLRGWRDVVPYSALWASAMFALDVLVIVPRSGWGIVEDWGVWVGYLLVLVIPLFTARFFSLSSR